MAASEVQVTLIPFLENSGPRQNAPYEDTLELPFDGAHSRTGAYVQNGDRGVTVVVYARPDSAALTL